MIEAGAAGVHFEDQLASVKKCGHMGGKVLVPTREAVEKLVAARLAADVMGVPTLIVARTDAEAADLLTADIDPNDQPFVTGERTVEGFYKTRNGLDQAISRGLAYAPYADLVWCETGKPDLEFARKFAEAIHAKFPGKLLAYNCSPSFNWKKNLDDATIAKFQKELASYGYKFQFITLAGFHSLNYGMFNLAHGYARRQMSAFVELQEAEFAAADQRLHRGQAPARSRHRLLRRGDPDHPGRPVLDRRAQGLDRGRAVPRRRKSPPDRAARRDARPLRRAARRVHPHGGDDQQPPASRYRRRPAQRRYGAGWPASGARRRLLIRAGDILPRCAAGSRGMKRQTQRPQSAANQPNRRRPAQRPGHRGADRTPSTRCSPRSAARAAPMPAKCCSAAATSAPRCT